MVDGYYKNVQDLKYSSAEDPQMFYKEHLLMLTPTRGGRSGILSQSHRILSHIILLGDMPSATV